MIFLRSFRKTTKRFTHNLIQSFHNLTTTCKFIHIYIPHEHTNTNICRVCESVLNVRNALQFLMLARSWSSFLLRRFDGLRIDVLHIVVADARNPIARAQRDHRGGHIVVGNRTANDGPQQHGAEAEQAAAQQAVCGRVLRGRRG